MAFNSILTSALVIHFIALLFLTLQSVHANCFITVDMEVTKAVDGFLKVRTSNDAKIVSCIAAVAFLPLLFSTKHCSYEKFPP